MRLDHLGDSELDFQRQAKLDWVERFVRESCRVLYCMPVRSEGYSTGPK